MKPVRRFSKWNQNIIDTGAELRNETFRRNVAVVNKTHSKTNGARILTLLENDKAKMHQEKSKLEMIVGTFCRYQ